MNSAQNPLICGKIYARACWSVIQFFHTFFHPRRYIFDHGAAPPQPPRIFNGGLSDYSMGFNDHRLGAESWKGTRDFFGGLDANRPRTPKYSASVRQTVWQATGTFLPPQMQLAMDRTRSTRGCPKFGQNARQKPCWALVP